jgi:hypothetical protein
MFGWLIGQTNAAQEDEESQETSTTMEMEEPNLEVVNAHQNPPPIQATVPEIFVKVLPDVHLTVPNVLILGEQSSGKTRLILSLIFYYLIDHPLLTNEMGMSLLKLFKTGQSMVTRRPTTVKLIHSTEENVIHINLIYQNQVYEFGQPQFAQLIEQMSSAPEGELFKEEIIVQIITNNIPDLVFTDYPGITTVDRVLSDAAENDEIKTLKQLVESKIKQPYNTLVIVEPAAKEDFSTSHIFPFLQ